MESYLQLAKMLPFRLKLHLIDLVTNLLKSEIGLSKDPGDLSDVDSLGLDLDYKLDQIHAFFNFIQNINLDLHA